MHVRQLRLQNFLRHKSTTVALPESGIVTVTGPNGSGKSSFVEAVAFGIFGKTVRGTDPWAGPNGSLLVETDAVQVTRERKKGRVLLSWQRNDVLAPNDFGTPTKAQDALDALLGLSLDVWRKTAVFSSADAANFTLATDGERKRLLESLLCLSQFDDALIVCRTHLRIEETTLSIAERDRDVAVARLESAEKALAAALKLSESDGGAVPDAAREEAAARELLRQVRAEFMRGEEIIRKRRAETRALDADATDAKATLRHAKDALRLLAGGNCPTCEQPISDERMKELVNTVSDAESNAAALSKKAQEATELAAGDIAELEEEQSVLRRRETELAARIRGICDAMRRQDDVASMVRGARDDAHAARGELQAAVERVQVASQKLPLLRACEDALGLRGVRAQLLGRALGGLERAANVYLRRVAGSGLELKLKPFSEKKTGGISDAIALEVVGAGNGNGYRAASGGERRRIDVALLLALAEIAAASRGARPGTLFFDEVFDTLDEAGVDAVSGILEELSTDRVIVVITHSATLAKRLPGRRISVLDGQARVE